MIQAIIRAGLCAGLFLLPACTLGDLADARATLKGAGAAAKSYVSEQIETRKEYRAGIRATIRAEYAASMFAADTASRAGDMETAQKHWAAARALYNEHIPQLKDLKAKVADFFDDD